jgi:hypothetical protein
MRRGNWHEKPREIRNNVGKQQKLPLIFVQECRSYFPLAPFRVPTLHTSQRAGFFSIHYSWYFAACAILRSAINTVLVHALEERETFHCRFFSARNADDVLIIDSNGQESRCHARGMSTDAREEGANGTRSS